MKGARAIWITNSNYETRATLNLHQFQDSSADWRLNPVPSKRSLAVSMAVTFLASGGVDLAAPSPFSMSSGPFLLNLMLSKISSSWGFEESNHRIKLKSPGELTEEATIIDLKTGKSQNSALAGVTSTQALVNMEGDAAQHRRVASEVFKVERSYLKMETGSIIHSDPQCGDEFSSNHKHDEVKCHLNTGFMKSLSNLGWSKRVAVSARL